SLLQEVVDGGQTSMVETLLLKEFGLRDRVLLPKPDDGVSAERYEMSSDLKGGEVLEPKKGLLENVLILDYKSLYPTIMMAHNLCYTTVVTGDRSDGVTIRPPSGGEFVPSEVYKGIVPSILEDLLNKRTQTKKRMRGASNENEYRVLDATQLALKILLNSFYGYSGYARARLYSLTLANAVTSFGRNNILNTREIINSTIGKIILRNKTALLLDEAGELSPQDRVVELSVAYGDTDSVFVHCKSRGDLSLEEVSLIGNRLANIVSASLPDPMELEFESIAKRALLIAKKRYALWFFEPKNSGWEDKIKVKGMETVRRDWCELTSITLNRVLELVLIKGDVDQAVEHVRQIVSKVRNLDPAKDSDIIESLVLTRTLTRKIESYKNKQPHLTVAENLKKRTGVVPSIGTRIPFVITAGKGLFVDRAEDPDYVREKNIPIDVDYYIKKQILPPVERILEVFGVKMSSLDFDSKQKGLFDFEAKKPEIKKQEKEKVSSQRKSKGITQEEKVQCPENGRAEQRSLFDWT
ncbi:MAG TPA: DNA-directed DNA polymerase, partial [Methanosarcina vacuolata]|nr:DNA-directed DNA polymerase [Methanosarcina vacuolata]